MDVSEIKTEREFSGEYKTDNIENVLVIQLESLDKNVMDFVHNGREVTPFLNELKNKSLYFDDIYAHHINGSFDAEFSFFTSLYPINRNFAFRTNDMGEFNSIARVLNNDDYQTLAFHGNDDGFFYRDKGYLEMGFDRFYSRDDYILDENGIGEDYYLGINDYDLFKQSLPFLEKAEQPFFSIFITVTSHTPFTFYPEDYRVEEFEDIDRPIVRDYFNSMYFVDQSMEMFFEGLDEIGLIDNTLIVVYSDHVADVHGDIYSSGGNFETERNIKEPEHIPLFIYHPDLEAEEISKTGSHTDIAPTILDILGYEEKPEEFLGVSLLKDMETPVLFLHEIPQILYKDQLFIRLPGGADEDPSFEKIAYKKDTGEEKIPLPDAEMIRLNNTINYMQEVMNTILSE